MQFNAANTINNGIVRNYKRRMLWRNFEDVLLFLFFMAGPFIQLCQCLFIGLDLPDGFIGAVKFIIIVIPALVNFKKINPYSILLGYILLVAVLLSMTNNDISESVINIFLNGEYLVGLTLCIFFAETKNPKQILSVVQKASYVVIVCMIAVMFLGGFNNWQHSGYMEFGYGTILFWIIILQKAFLQKKGSDILFLIVSGTILIIYGNRGVIVVVGCMLIIYILLYLNTSKKAVMILLLSIITLIGYLFFREIIGFIENILNYIGIYSRTIEKLIKGNMVIDYSRQAIKNQILELVNMRPLLGWGIGADRALIGQYAHNIILELWLSFGLIIGNLVFFSFIGIGIYMIKEFKKSDWLNLFIPFFGTSFIILFLSKSIFTMSEFGVAIMIFFACLYNTKKIKVLKS